jgi:hypothetical protein
MTRYLICGGRDFADYVTMTKALNVLILHPEHSLIIHGDARGADRLAGQWGREHGAQVQAVPADWAGNGMAAGPIRNAKMLDDYRPDVVIAFPGGRGTDDMIRKSRQRKLVVVQVVT